MYSQDELMSIYTFMKSTGEGNLKKMLVSGKFTELHFKVLMKIVRSCKDTEFADHWINNTFPRLKLAGPEIAVKEALWGLSVDAFVTVGLLNKTAKAA